MENKRMYKITEDQYNKILEWGEVGTSSDEISLSSANNKPETVIKTNRANLSNAASKANDTGATKIEITDSNVSESIISKKDLISEARRDWKKGTKVVKLSSLLKK